MKSEILKVMETDKIVAMKEEVTARKTGAEVHLAGLGCVAVKNATRAIKSMAKYIDKKPEDMTDDDVIGLTRRYIREQQEEYLMRHALGTQAEGLNKRDYDNLISENIALFESIIVERVPEVLAAMKYLPVAPTEDEIESWIDENIDFSTYNNPMQSMKDIKAHFGSTVDGKVLSKIVRAISYIG